MTGGRQELISKYCTANETRIENPNTSIVYQIQNEPEQNLGNIFHTAYHFMGVCNAQHFIIESIDRI